MSATSPLPTPETFAQAAADAIRVDRTQHWNTRTGSATDLVCGAAAMVWAQQAARDRALFRQCYTDTAQGARLEEIVLRRYGVSRIPATRGVGEALLKRGPGGAAGWLYEGTRIGVRKQITAETAFYAVGADTQVPAGVELLTVPIRATRAGTGTKLDKAGYAELADKAFAPFEVLHIWCADGTDEEAPASYVARARQARKDARPGYRKRFEDVCRAAGAEHVVILDAAEFGPAADFGVTHVYVADVGFSSPQALVDACWLAVHDVHVAGCDVQVLGMAPAAVACDLTVALWGDPGQFDQSGLRQAIASRVLGAFNKRPRRYLFDHDSIAAEAHAAGGSDVQAVGVTTDPAPPVPGFVPVLPWYTLAPSALSIAFTGPT